ncbi:L-histidine N(alpha)-methyltransferase [Ramlibacter sp.]|uniref:L-histidine N(alpha)-methyltransferase n=1 Tax=Ramlibacter sp. TaxID=1917967 RepID=UPI0039C9E19D
MRSMTALADNAAPPPDHQGPPASDSAFAHDLVAALAARPRSISPKYFYDARGSQLFERICELPEYYPTRTELDILRTHARELAALMGPRAEIVEFGAGSLRKVRLLLDAMERPARYLPIDISGEHLAQAAAALQRDYAGLEVQPVTADYTQRLLLPARLPGAGQRVGFFPGSTIGNFTPAEALQFLGAAAQVLRGGALLLGADLVKDPAVLHAAYNDAQGVTAEFNLNLLARANRELGASFVLEQFAHSAFYNAPWQRIEMHLVSRCRQQVSVGRRSFQIEEGETLHTEHSHKFTVAGLHELARRAGFRPGPVWTDEQRLFSVHWLQAPQEGDAA